MEGDRKIWIDLENSPHVPFFVPIIEELRLRAYSVVVTGRDCFQVGDLAKLLGLDCKLVGSHSGKNRVFKLLGLCYRSLQLDLAIWGEKPDLALSHGSRSQVIASKLLGIPHLLLSDYEHALGLGYIGPTWIMTPEVISDRDIHWGSKQILKYPGIKEDVYVYRFRPDVTIRPRLGIADSDLLVTVRPPANEAHYHNPESDELFHSVIDFLGEKPNLKILLLPRNEKQETSARQAWPALFMAGNLQVPEHVLDGRNLIWNSDFVVSGGGTMIREAAALGVPAYSTFRGKIGAVDKYLAEKGRLVLLESLEDIHTKIALTRRTLSMQPAGAHSPALEVIIKTIVSILESPCRCGQRQIQ